MGAHNIEFDIPDCNRDKVLKAFNDVRSRDKDYNGHQQGYSGDFQTVSDVKIHDKIFESYNEAHEYCLEHAQKWEYVIAVKYRDFSKLEKNTTFKEIIEKKLEELKLRLKTENELLEKIKTKNQEGLINAVSKTIGCKKCESKINRKFINKNSLSCPVCHTTLLSKTALEQLENKNTKIQEITKKIEEEKRAIINKNKDLSEVRWLIAGWGAC